VGKIMSKVRVLIVADDPLARTGLAALLANHPQCIVVGQVARGVELADDVAVYQPNVVLWDLGWEPDLELLLELGDVDLPLLLLLPDVTYADDAWTTGVQGLLPRDVDAETLVVALLSVAQGLAVLEPGLAAALLPTRRESPESLVEDLTPRELDVLQLLAEGLPNKTIAYRLEISEHTVKFHVNAILGKLGVQSRTEAVVRATRLGLIIL
jgi:two-component system nitrate/nitrite response regulator NarL